VPQGPGGRIRGRTSANYLECACVLLIPCGSQPSHRRMLHAACIALNIPSWHGRGQPLWPCRPWRVVSRTEPVLDARFERHPCPKVAIGRIGPGSDAGMESTLPTRVLPTLGMLRSRSGKGRRRCRRIDQGQQSKTLDTSARMSVAVYGRRAKRQRNWWPFAAPRARLSA
jgi:hypothetical protein